MNYIKPEEKKQIIEEIQYFFREEYDMNLGLIGAENILEFFTEMLGNRIYNQSLEDAKRFFMRYLDGMETDFYALYKE